jgi:HEAT repeat protein
MKPMVAGIVFALCVAVFAVGDNAWDAREARAVREGIYLQIESLPDFAQIKGTFEKGLSGDASAAPGLVALLKHGNEDVASTAAQMLGRFPSTTAAQALKDSYATETRLFVKAAALAGLARMKDADGIVLARAALQGDDPAMQGAGLGALEALGDAAQSPAILDYYSRHPEEVSGDGLESLGALGDPPGSTAVRDRLVAEASNKRNSFDFRYSAALGLRKMGQEQLVKAIFDIAKARGTNDNLIVAKGAMQRLAATTGATVKSQAAVDVLLRDVDLGLRDRQDLWKRPLRAGFVSTGVFHVISDGPDMIPDTADDMSTAEPYDIYISRVFPDQF